MPKQSRAQKNTVGRVMYEWKHGELESSRGGKVKSRRQAVAIALSEAGASRGQSPKQKRRQFRRTKRKEYAGQTAQALKEGQRRSNARRSGGPTRAELYREATRKGVRGRSRMSKARLQRALSA